MERHLMAKRGDPDLVLGAAPREEASFACTREERSTEPDVELVDCPIAPFAQGALAGLIS